MLTDDEILGTPTGLPPPPTIKKGMLRKMVVIRKTNTNQYVVVGFNWSLAFGSKEVALEFCKNKNLYIRNQI